MRCQMLYGDMHGCLCVVKWFNDRSCDSIFMDNAKNKRVLNVQKSFLFNIS